MTRTAKTLLDAFEALPEPERGEVAREILRRTTLAKHGPLEDAELVALDDEMFLELDRACSSLHQPEGLPLRGVPPH